MRFWSRLAEFVPAARRRGRSDSVLLAAGTRTAWGCCSVDGKCRLGICPEQGALTVWCGRYARTVHKVDPRSLLMNTWLQGLRTQQTEQGKAWIV